MEKVEKKSKRLAPWRSFDDTTSNMTVEKGVFHRYAIVPLVYIHLLSLHLLQLAYTTSLMKSRIQKCLYKWTIYKGDINELLSIIKKTLQINSFKKILLENTEDHHIKEEVVSTTMCLASTVDTTDLLHVVGILTSFPSQKQKSHTTGR